MTAPRHRAWRFSFEPAGGDGRPRGLDIAASGGTAMAEGEAAVRQAILLLLATAPGERVMRPGYGCDLRQLLFAPNDDTTAGLAIHHVRQALLRWEPRIDIVRLDARRAPEAPGQLDIVLEYRLRATRQPGVLVVPLRLTGESR